MDLGSEAGVTKGTKGRCHVSTGNRVCDKRMRNMTQHDICRGVSRHDGGEAAPSWTLGLARGKRKADKRHAIKERDWKRDKQRLMKVRG